MSQIKDKQVCVQLTTWHYPHPAATRWRNAAPRLLLTAGRAALDRSSARRVHSSKPEAAACGGRKGQTDKWMNARVFHRPCSALLCGQFQKVGWTNKTNVCCL